MSGYFETKRRTHPIKLGDTIDGKRWTLNGSESPRDASVCSLSDVLETEPVPQRYFLSAKACAGILRRAENRGKKLPDALYQALQAALTPNAGGGS